MRKWRQKDQKKQKKSNPKAADFYTPDLEAKSGSNKKDPPIKWSQLKKSIANRFPPEFDINDVDDKKEMFIRELLTAPTTLLGEINGRLASDDNSLSVSDRLSTIMKKLDDKQVTDLPHKEKYFIYELVANAIKHMKLIKNPYVDEEELDDPVVEHVNFDIFRKSYQVKNENYITENIDNIYHKTSTENLQEIVNRYGGIGQVINNLSNRSNTTNLLLEMYSYYHHYLGTMPDKISSGKRKLITSWIVQQLKEESLQDIADNEHVNLLNEKINKIINKHGGIKKIIHKLSNLNEENIIHNKVYNQLVEYYCYSTRQIPYDQVLSKNYTGMRNLLIEQLKQELPESSPRESDSNLNKLKLLAGI